MVELYSKIYACGFRAVVTEQGRCTPAYIREQQDRARRFPCHRSDCPVCTKYSAEIIARMNN
jgi:hypothetical protein